MRTCHARTAKRRFVTTFATPLLLALACQLSAHAQCQYEVTAIIEGPPCWNSTLPLVGRSMNSHGHVVGSYMQCSVTADEAFYWTPETGLVTLPRPDGIVSALAMDINDSGTIVGVHRVSQFGQWTGFTWHPDEGTFNYLEPPHGIGGSSLNAINNAGMAVGSRSILGKPGQYNAVIWDTNTGEVIDLGVGVGEGPNSEAMDISESGEYVVGWANGTGPNHGQAAIWTNGRLEVIGPLPGTDNSIVNAVNESGVAVGSGLHQTIGWRAFIWDGAFTIIDGEDGWQAARGRAINNLGQALIQFSQLQQGHTPLLWQHGELHYLQPLLAPSPPSITLSSIGGMNDNGQILCSATGNFSVVLSPADRPLTDLNADCRTDVHDLLMLLDTWGRVPRGSNAPADFNGDGVVDVSDLLILLANWTMP